MEVSFNAEEAAAAVIPAAVASLLPVEIQEQTQVTETEHTTTVRPSKLLNVMCDDEIQRKY